MTPCSKVTLTLTLTCSAYFFFIFLSLLRFPRGTLLGSVRFVPFRERKGKECEGKRKGNKTGISGKQRGFYCSWRHQSKEHGTTVEQEQETKTTTSKNNACTTDNTRTPCLGGTVLT